MSEKVKYVVLVDQLGNLARRGDVISDSDLTEERLSHFLAKNVLRAASVEEAKHSRVQLEKLSRPSVEEEVGNLKRKIKQLETELSKSRAQEQYWQKEAKNAKPPEHDKVKEALEKKLQEQNVLIDELRKQVQDKKQDKK